MPKPPPLRHILEIAVSWLCLAAVLAVAACGPGTGGTGTGPISGLAMQPSATYYAGTLGGTSTIGLGPGNPATGSANGSNTAVVTPGCSANCAAVAVNLQLEPQRIQLGSGCFSFVFTGSWSFAASGETTVLGSFQSLSTVNGHTVAGDKLPSTLVISFPNDETLGNLLTLSIKDNTGRLLLGPTTLQRSADAPPPTSARAC